MAVTLVLWLLGLAYAQEARQGVDMAGKELPRVFCLIPIKLAESKARVIGGDESLQPAMERLRMDADEAPKAGPFSVMDKTSTPPSGDKHDQMSLGPYWWPDPQNADGPPYIRRDGRSIRKALDFLASYADPKKKWSYKQITRSEPAALFSLLRRGSVAYEDGKYEAVVKKIQPEDIVADRTNLLLPQASV